MSVGENKAVFLSYASQDADAAKRICDALRQAGVEVWFDQSELRGGDAWDTKIRKQIKECALFVPVISANTQARREGYFRIEWKLAAQRTHAIAEGTPFLVPVILDDVPEPSALVPAEFREVQWTPLAAPDSTVKFASRVRGLVGGGEERVAAEDAPRRAAEPVERPHRRTRFTGPVLVVLGAILLLVVSLIVWRGPRPKTPEAAAGSAATQNEKSIAVLPFENLNPGADGAAFADGMHEEVLTALVKVSALKVIARTSVLPYADVARRNLRQIAAELGVGALLEGSVRRSGNRVKITAQLVDPQSARQLWANSFERELTDVFAIQSAIAQEIATTLKTTLTAGERSLLNRRPTESAVAYEYFLQAKLLSASLFSPSPPEDWERVFGLLEKSIEADPKFAQAYALLARTHAARYFYKRRDMPEQRERARERLEVARQLAPDAPETRTAEGFFAYACLLDYPAAVRSLEQALADIPNDARTWYYLGLAKRRLGQSVEGVAAMERALQLDPRDSAVISNLMLSLMQLRRFARVLELGRVREARGDDLVGVFAVTVARYEIDGNRDALLAGCRAWVPIGTQRDERPDVIAALLTGGLEEAARAAEKIEGPLRAYQQALFAHLLGRAEPARAFARTAEADNDARLPALDWPHTHEVRAIELLMYSGYGVEALARARALEPKLHGIDDIHETSARNRLGRVYCLAGARDDALRILRELMTGLGTIEATPRMVRLDPCWSKLADDPRFEEILRAAKPL